MLCADLFVDDLIRIAFVWSSIEIHDEAIKDTVFVSMGLDPRMTVLYGYIGCFVMMTVVRHIAVNMIAQSSNETFKVTVERIYVAMAAITGIMVWDGM